jgi:metal-sulfur cluster biosynthetic enzyme
MGAVTKQAVLDELAKVIDPELGRSILELDLVDKLDIEDDSVAVEFHLTSPYCPPMFAMKIAQDVKDYTSQVKGVKGVEIKVKGHYMADYVNDTVNK